MVSMPECERLLTITRIENEFWGGQAIRLGGMDEVGRGPLAGPVVAACVVLPSCPLIPFVKDSKALTQARRELLYTHILELAQGYALGWVDHTTIDEINILQAARLAFKKAYEGMRPQPTDVLVDALNGLDITARQHAYVHGDSISYLIAAASIVAKVERDRYMVEQDAVYPQYGFARNKGYGTPEHILALREHGPCPLHRRSFIGRILHHE